MSASAPVTLRRGTMSKMFKNHYVMMNLAEGDRHQWVCEAPPRTMCLVKWDCECEMWSHERDVDGTPTHDHLDYPLFSEPAPCTGAYDAADECLYAPWVEECDALQGVVRVGVAIVFEDFFLEFHAETACVDGPHVGG